MLSSRSHPLLYTYWGLAGAVHSLTKYSELLYKVLQSFQNKKNSQLFTTLLVKRSASKRHLFDISGQPENGLEIIVKIVLNLRNSVCSIAFMCNLTIHVSIPLRIHLHGADLCKTAARCLLERYMVQGIKIICNNSLISDAFSGSVCVISDNRIMSEIEVLAGKPEGKRTV
jgi:hypothetical protein